MKPAGILITRPAEQAAKTARKLEQLGARVWLAPLLNILPVMWEPPGQGVQAIILTSGNALPALVASSLARTIPVYAVGDKTAAQVRAAGFTQVWSADGGVNELAALVCRQCISGFGSLLYLTGDVVAGQLAARLSAAGYWVEKRVVYSAQSANTLPDDVLCALAEESISTVLLYSPRTASIFARLAEGQGWRAALTLVCLSPAIAQAAGSGWAEVKIAAHPDEESLLKILTAGSESV